MPCATTYRLLGPGIAANTNTIRVKVISVEAVGIGRSRLDDRLRQRRADDLHAPRLARQPCERLGSALARAGRRVELRVAELHPARRRRGASARASQAG